MARCALRAQRGFFDIVVVVHSQILTLTFFQLSFGKTAIAFGKPPLLKKPQNPKVLGDFERVGPGENHWRFPAGEVEAEATTRQ